MGNKAKTVLKLYFRSLNERKSVWEVGFFSQMDFKKDVSWRKTVKLFKNRENGCRGTSSFSQNGHKMGSKGSQEVFPGAICIKKSELFD